MRVPFIISSILIIILSCAAPQSSLLDYHGKSTDEKQVIHIISEFENATNAYDAQKLYSLYASEAAIQTSTKHGSLNWEILNREDWISIIKRRFKESYVNSGLKFKFFEPESIEIQIDDASVVIPYKLSSLKISYIETGLFKFEMKKKKFGWAIIKFRYEILTSNHRQWNEYQEWLKKRQ